MAARLPRDAADAALVGPSPETGLLAWHNAWIKGPSVVQYWRSFEDLDRFARATDEPHLPAWKTFNKAVRASGDVGIWHETYKVHDRPPLPASRGGRG